MKLKKKTIINGTAYSWCVHSCGQQIKKHLKANITISSHRWRKGNNSIDMAYGYCRVETSYVQNCSFSKFKNIAEKNIAEKADLSWHALGL